MIALALLLASQPPAVSDVELLETFKAACTRVEDVEALKADAAARGWTAIAEDADPRVAKLNQHGRETVGEEGRLSGGTFRRRLAGRDLFLIVSRYEDKESGFWGSGCRLYDFAATAPLDAAALQAWMAKPPTATEQPAPGLERRLWEPGWREGMTVEASYVPAGHPLGKAFGVQGNVLIAQAIGGIE